MYLNKIKFIACLFLICFSFLEVKCETVKTEADVISANKTKGIVLLEGNAQISYTDLQIFADYIRFDKINGIVFANGNVKATLKYSKLQGEEVTYYLDNGKVLLKNGSLAIEGFRFEAAQIETENQDKFYLTNAKFTSCPDGCDKWYFKAKKIKVKREGYATFKSLKFEINGRTYLYLPAFIYPAKTKRAAGLLMPSFGGSSKYGFKFNQKLFIPIGNSHDVTLETDYYENAGTGLGFEYRLSRIPGEFGRFYGYSIKDKLKLNEEENPARRTFSDITYSYNSSLFNINLDLFEGNDFDIVRDFNFDKYSFAMRQYYTNFLLNFKNNHFNFSIGANRRKILFKEGNERFNTLPSVNVVSNNLFFLNRSVNLYGTAEVIDSPFFNKNVTRTKLGVTVRKNYSLKSLTLVETFKFNYTNYDNNNYLQSFTSGEFSYKLNSPSFVKKREESITKINFFAESGYRTTSKNFPVKLYDLNDYINPEGIFFKTGVETVFSVSEKIATGGLYIEKTFGNNYFHNFVLTDKVSDFAPVKAYVTLPFKRVSLNLFASYDTALNELDTLSLNARFSNNIRLSYLKAYTYGEETKRDSAILSYTKQISDKWNASFLVDYDFKISDFRYQIYSITYYNKCIGFSLKYLNNTYTLRDDNEVTISLILKDIGEFLKYKMGI